MDGSGTTPGFTHRSITDAAAASPGDTIEIAGLVDSANLPGGYTNGTPLFASTGQPPELFPITLPVGVTLRQSGNTQVFIWESFGGASPVDLFLVSSSTILSPTTFRDLTFVGGGVAIHAEVTGAGLRADVIVRDCRFSNNQTGTRAASLTGGLVQMGLLNCALSDSTAAISPSLSPPIFQAPRFGFRFSAVESSGGTPSSTVGRIEELSVSGAFSSMDPQPDSYTSDLPVPVTRVVDVSVLGSEPSNVHFPGAPASYTPAEIPEVDLDILGGTWRGAAGPSGAGWGCAIFAEGMGADPNDVMNYFSGYRINVTGTQMSGFREDGIYCMSSLSSRGHLNLNGQASITGTGFVEPFSEVRSSGVHIYSRESYMALTGSSFETSDNQGNGIYLNTDGEYFASTKSLRLTVPSGLYLGVTKLNVHNNGASGFYLRNEHAQPSGFIGGTIHQISPSNDFSIDDGIRDFTYMDGEALPNGQGLMNRSAISNNGFSGIKIVAEGGSGIVPGKPTEAPSGVAPRVTNDFIWNNPRGGLDARWEVPAGFSDSAPKGYYLVPVTHTTMVGNGGPGFDYSMEIDDRNGASIYTRAYYEWADPAPSTFFAKTNVWNSILVRDPVSGSGVDLGPELGLTPFNSVEDDGTPGIVGPRMIGFAGVRGNGFWSSSLTGPVNSIQTIIPFVGAGSPGTFSLTSTNLAQFKLFSPGPVDEIVDLTPTYFNVLSPESLQDYGAQVRPTETSGVRDKGADEVD